MKRLTYQIICWLPVVLIGFLHALGILGKVCNIPPRTYGQFAEEICVTERWRYGYVCGHHGAVLVKTRNVPGAKPAVQAGGVAELSQAMLIELRSYPQKSVLEALLYGAILAYALVLITHLRNWLNARSRIWSLALLREAAFWAGGWTLFVAPLLWLDYGASMYTTWVGPGYLSWSGPYLGTFTGVAGETVSYRPLLEIWSALPVLVVRPDWLRLVMPAMNMAQYIWLAGAVCWGLVGAMVGLSTSVTLRRH